MTPFMNEDFLLTTETAKKLYHEVAEHLPIIDYHCHISPQEIYEDRKFDNLAQVWLGGDHYKWRVLRASGIPEEAVTGNAPDEEKFRAFAKVMPRIIGNPIYHWSHLELKRTFGIDTPLTSKTADAIYEQANAYLQTTSTRGLMKQFDVRAICTTDDPADDLKWHQLIAEDETFDIQVRPTFRPDKAVNVDKPGFDAYIAKLSQVVGRPLNSAADVAAALVERMDYFASKGCFLADHGLDYVMFETPDEAIVEEAFAIGMRGEKPSVKQTDAYKTYITGVCAKRYTELNWVMQLHFGCLRNTNSPMFAKLGPDTGYDTINSRSGVENLAALLDYFQANEGLPKTILYSLNGADNEAIITTMGCFQGGGVAGKLQHGSAWWFNDSRPGMRDQLINLAGNGVLGQFVGMLTDSRSFLSYPRHEYFRRVLCELIGEWVESGQYPDDWEELSSLVADLCFHNTNNYFGFNVEI